MLLTQAKDWHIYTKDSYWQRAASVHRPSAPREGLKRVSVSLQYLKCHLREPLWILPSRLSLIQQ